jgi:hypothetical protein
MKELVGKTQFVLPLFTLCDARVSALVVIVLTVHVKESENGRLVQF